MESNFSKFFTALQTDTTEVRQRERSTSRRRAPSPRGNTPRARTYAIATRQQGQGNGNSYLAAAQTGFQRGENNQTGFLTVRNRRADRRRSRSRLSRIHQTAPEALSPAEEIERRIERAQMIRGGVKPVYFTKEGIGTRISNMKRMLANAESNLEH